MRTVRKLGMVVMVVMAVILAACTGGQTVPADNPERHRHRSRRLDTNCRSADDLDHDDHDDTPAGATVLGFGSASTSRS